VPVKLFTYCNEYYALFTAPAQAGACRAVHIL
jgi:hypothetical protein